LEERVKLAWLCQFKRLNHAATSFFKEAFAVAPKLTDNLGARSSAARVAALAGCGQGKDSDKLDDKERERLRLQALEWLRADLTAWRLLLDKDAAKVWPTVRAKMRYWLADRAFAGVRGPEALAKLPDDERRAWQQLWDDVAGLLKKALEAQP